MRYYSEVFQKLTLGAALTPLGVIAAVMALVGIGLILH
jgi:hypothetical protein